MKHTIVRYTLAIIGLFSVTSCTDYLDNAPDDILTLDMVFNSKTVSYTHLTLPTICSV